MANTISHSELLKATKKAVNSLMFNPTPSKKVEAIKALALCCEFVAEVEAPKEEPKPKASKSKKKPKASKAKPKASKSKSKSSRKAEIEAVLTSGKKLKRAERSVLNKELHKLLQEEKRKTKSKTSKKTVRRPKRTSADGLELTQAKTATANKVGKVKKTKVVNAVDGGAAQPFEPRMEVPVIEPKARKKQQMKLTLLPGESVDEAMARHRSAVLERERLEAEALIANSNPMMEPSFAPAV